MFVAVLGASNYTFVEATLGQELRDWIGSHNYVSLHLAAKRALLIEGRLTNRISPDDVV